LEFSPDTSAASFNPGYAFRDLDAIKQVLDVLEKNGVKILDTTQRYGESERLLGEVGAGDRFIIDAKSAGGLKVSSPTQHSVSNFECLNISHKSLKLKMQKSMRN